MTPNIVLDRNINEAREKQTHEESQSGLTISVQQPGRQCPAKRPQCHSYSPDTGQQNLQSLELFEGGKALGKDIKNIGKNGVGKPGIHVGLGSSSFKQEYSTDTNTYAGGSLSSNVL
jgi:filamentous hemagglutinin